MAEAKAKKTGKEVTTRLGSTITVKKGEETGTMVAGKKPGKETKAGEDLGMNHRVTVIAEATRLQKVESSGIGEFGQS